MSPVRNRHETTSSRRVELDFDEIENDDDKAAIRFVFVDARGKEKVMWVPRTWIEDLDEYARTVSLPEWYAIEKGLV